MKITKNMIKPKTVFRCDTEEKAYELLKKLDELGCKWCDGQSYLKRDCYGVFREDTCYYPFYGEFSNSNFYSDDNHKITEYKLDDDADYKLLLDKANKRISELEQAIKHLQRSNGNKESRIKNLKNKLEKKDKALQKACELIEHLESEEVRFCTCPVESYDYTPECCNEDFCNGCNSKCWKDWFEHEN
ncbi:MAG: hypothetical protein RSE50_12715 [Myroides sp.]